MVDGGCGTNGGERDGGWVGASVVWMRENSGLGIGCDGCMVEVGYGDGYGRDGCGGFGDHRAEG